MCDFYCYMSIWMKLWYFFSWEHQMHVVHLSLCLFINFACFIFRYQPHKKTVVQPPNMKTSKFQEQTRSAFLMTEKYIVKQHLRYNQNLSHTNQEPYSSSKVISSSTSTARWHSCGTSQHPAVFSSFSFLFEDSTVVKSECSVSEKMHDQEHDDWFLFYFFIFSIFNIQ